MVLSYMKEMLIEMCQFAGVPKPKLRHSIIFSNLSFSVCRTECTSNTMSEVRIERAETNRSAFFRISASSLVKRNIVRI